MKRRYVVLILAVFCLVLAIGSIALARPTGFYMSMPTFGHKTMASGTKLMGGEDYNYWEIFLNENVEHSNTLITMWCDVEGTKASNDVSLYPGGHDVKRYDVRAPQVSERMELRVKSSGIGGWYLSGSVDFDHYQQP